MTGFDIYSAIGGTDEKFLEESEAPCKRKTDLLPIVSAVSVAASIAIIAAGSFLTTRVIDPQPGVTYEITTAGINSETAFTDDADGGIRQDIEKIDPAVSFGGMGFEGLMAYDISELSTPEPWNAEMELSSLPV